MQAYAIRYHGSDATVTPLAELPKPCSPVSLAETLATACKGVAGITPAVFRSLLSPEDLADIEAGHYLPATFRAYAESMAEGVHSGRLALLGDRQGQTHPPACGGAWGFYGRPAAPPRLSQPRPQRGMSDRRRGAVHRKATGLLDDLPSRCVAFALKYSGLD